MALVRRVVRLAIVLVAAGAAGVGLTACFSPQQPGCAFSCASDGLCPSGYSCRTDNLCHRDDGQGICNLVGVTGDAAVGGDGAATDGAGATDAGDGSAGQ